MEPMVSRSSNSRSGSRDDGRSSPLAGLEPASGIVTWWTGELGCLWLGDVPDHRRDGSNDQKAHHAVEAAEEQINDKGRTVGFLEALDGSPCRDRDAGDHTEALDEGAV